MIDSAELFYTVLSSDSGVLAEVEDDDGVQVYGPPGLPPDFSIRKAVMFIGNGGDTNEYVPIGVEEFEVYCYGKDSQEARGVYRAVVAALDRRNHHTVAVTGGNALFQYAIKRSGPQDRVDPQEGWMFVYTSFEMHFAERLI